MDENKVPMENTATQPRKKGKLILAVCAVLLVAAIVIGCVSAVMAADPIKQVEDAFANNMKAAVPTKEGKIQKMVKDGGSLEVSWDADLLMADLVGLPLDVDAIIKYFVDYEAQKAAMTANVNFSGMSLLDAVMTYDSNRYAVSSKALLGDKAYGVDLSTLGETFPNSALAKLVDIDLEGFAEQYAAVLANQENTSELQKELIKLYRDTWNMLKASLKEHAVTEKGDTELLIGAKK